MNSSISNASTPPQRGTARSPASFSSTSRVDALYERQPQVSFIDSVASEDDETVYAASPPGATRHAEESPSTSCCWSCRQTQRLRSSLKRIELDYLAQIQSLQQQLKRATAQRALALRERDELLTNSDAAAARQSMIEQEAQSLRVEVMQVIQDRQELRSRVQHLELHCQRTTQQQVRQGIEFLESAEATAREALISAEGDERHLLTWLGRVEGRVAEEAAARAHVVETPRRCDVASGTLTNGSTILSSTFSPNSTTSPGPSDGGRERRTCSPRPSQLRELSSQHHTQRPSLTGESARSGSEGTLVVSRALVLSHTAEEAEEKVRKMEWRLEQQRSSFEMQLADERALTADMQAEVDDLIENELMLLETEGRLTIERDAAEARDALWLLHHHHLAEHLQQGEKRATEVSTHVDVLDLVEESENATWRTEMSEAMNAMQQQLYQLLSVAKSARAERGAWEEVRECVREEAAEMKQHLASLIDKSAQSRADSDALLEEVREHFSEVEERQCRQEAFMVSTLNKPAGQAEETSAQLRQQQLLFLQDLRHELEHQHQLNDKLCRMLASEAKAAAPDSVVTTGMRSVNTVTKATEAACCSMPAPNAKIRERSVNDVSGERGARYCNPAGDTLTSSPQLTSAASLASDAQRSKHVRSPVSRSYSDQTSNTMRVSDSTVEWGSSPLQRTSRAAGAKFVVAEEVLFDPQRIPADASAAVEQISALLSDASLSDAYIDAPSPYEEY
jgi:hypothetical protein